MVIILHCEMACTVQRRSTLHHECHDLHNAYVAMHLEEMVYMYFSRSLTTKDIDA